jgi:hypothetical protein
MSIWHVNLGMHPCCPEPISTASEAHVDLARPEISTAPPVRYMSIWHASGNNDSSTTSGPTSWLQSIHLLTLAPAPSWLTTNVSDMPRNRSLQVWITARRPRCWSKGSTSTRCCQLRFAAWWLTLMWARSWGRFIHLASTPNRQTLTLKTRWGCCKAFAFPHPLAHWTSSLGWANWATWDLIFKISIWRY